MAFPTVTTTSSVTNSNTTSHTVSLPASIAAGDGLLLVLCSWAAGGQFNTPSGFTSLVNVVNGTNVRIQVFWKVADGSEGASIAATTTGTTNTTHHAYKVAASSFQGTPEVASSNSSLNPPSLNPSAWDVEDTLWIAAGAGAFDGGGTVTGTPSGYTDAIANAAIDVAMRSMRKESAAASEDPGTFSSTGVLDGAVSVTIAIRPAAGGAEEIEATGALASQVSTLAGTAGPTVNATGTPASQNSTASGSVGVIVNVTGALASQASSIEGAINKPIFTGAIAAQNAEVAGTVGITLNFSGALASQAATLAGTAGVTINFDGALQSDASAVAGDATTDDELAVDGAIQSDDATISGTSDVIVNTSGALVTDVQLSGTVGITANFTGALAAEAATLSGVFSSQELPLSGSLQAQSAVIAGTVGIAINVNGALQANFVVPNTRKLLSVNFDGADGASSAVDASPNAWTMSFVNLAQIDTADFKFGTASLFLDNLDDRVTIPYNAAFQVTGNFTAHVQYRPTGSTSRVLFNKWDTDGSKRSFQLLVEADGTLTANISDDGAAVLTISSDPGAVVNDIFQHIAMVKIGTVLNLHVDGIIVATGTVPATWFDANTLFVIGNAVDGSAAALGHIDQVELIKEALWYKAFPPPSSVDIEALPISGQGSSLLNFTGSLTPDAAIIAGTHHQLVDAQLISAMQASPATVSGSISKSRIDRSDVIRLIQGGRFRFKVRTR